MLATGEGGQQTGGQQAGGTARRGSHRVLAKGGRCLVRRAAMAAATAFLAAHGGAAARTLEVGQGRDYGVPSAAAAAARDGDTVLIAPGEYADCAVWQAADLTIQGAGAAEGVVIADRTCQGKGLFVTVGDNITVRNLTLTRARAESGNGAGIRSEGTGLTVEGVRFVDNQNGILAGNRPGGTVIVRDSEFRSNGSCESPFGCAHGLYINAMALLRVEGSRFYDQREGHHIKSRAAATVVVGNSIQDGPDGTASYQIDIPNGGDVLVRGNVLQKGPHSGNPSAAIMIGAEGVNQPTPAILVEDNAFTNQSPSRTALVENRTATPAILRNNRVTGDVRLLRGEGTVQPEP